MGDNNTDLNLDETKLEESLEREVAKDGDTETPSETTTEKTDEKISKEVSTETETPQKTEETSKEKKEETEEDTRFDKHPRWIKRQQQLDEAQEERNKAQEKNKQYEEELLHLKEFKERLGNLDVNEITRLKTAGELLRKYPTLAEKVQKVIDEFEYGNEEVKTKIQTLEQKQVEFEQRQETQRLLDRYDNDVNRLVKDNKIDKEIEPIVREMLDNRVIKNRVPIDKVSQEFEKVIKDIDLIIRKKMASHIETKKAESKVPKSPEQRGKVMTTKNESEEAADVVDELTNALKSSRAEVSSE